MFPAETAKESDGRAKAARIRPRLGRENARYWLSRPELRNFRTLTTDGHRPGGVPTKARACRFIAIDVDATSATFANFKGLGVKRRKILERDAINPRIFDDITEEVLSADANFVIDTGASAFVELNRYLLKNAIPEHVVNAGKRFIAHVDHHRRRHLHRDECEP